MSKSPIAYVSLVLAGAVALVILAGAGCSRTTTVAKAPPGPATQKSAPATAPVAKVQPKTQTAVKPQAPVAPEVNPPGDIPDNQVFVTFKAADGSFRIKVPEGWPQRSATRYVRFSDKLNSVAISWKPAQFAPTRETAKSTDVKELNHSELAFRLVGVRQATLPGGRAIVINYQENSRPNSVTGKQYRMDVVRFEFFKKGVRADLTLSSPVGADNVDPWKLISESFRWLP